MSNYDFNSKTAEGYDIMGRIVSQFLGGTSRWLFDSELNTLVSALYQAEGDDLPGIGIINHVSRSDYSFVDPDCNPLAEVFRVTNPDGEWYFEISGYYVSHDGGYYDNFSEVEKKEKTVTVFE